MIDDRKDLLMKNDCRNMCYGKHKEETSLRLDMRS
jgi:hypothetical protein